MKLLSKRLRIWLSGIFDDASDAIVVIIGMVTGGIGGIFYIIMGVIGGIADTKRTKKKLEPTKIRYYAGTDREIAYRHIRMAELKDWGNVLLGGSEFGFSGLIFVIIMAMLFFIIMFDPRGFQSLMAKPTPYGMPFGLLTLGVFGYIEFHMWHGWVSMKWALADFRHIRILKRDPNDVRIEVIGNKRRTILLEPIKR